MAKMLEILNFNNFEIYGIEHVKELVKFSKRNIKENYNYLIEGKFIQIYDKDGRDGLKEKSPFDFINVGASI